MRLLAAVNGDPYDPQTQSGSAKHLLDALDADHDVTRVDYGMGTAESLVAAASTIRPSRDVWRRQYHASAVAARAQARRLSRTTRGQEFDLAVQVHGWMDPAAYHGPFVLYADTNFETLRRSWEAWLPRGAGAARRERRMITSARHVFMSNAHAAEALAAYGVPDDRISVVGGGRNFAVSEPFPRQREPTILFVGREFTRKGGVALLRAFETVRAELPEAQLLIAGTTDLPNVGPGVRVLGNIRDRDELGRAYRGAAVFCLPSLYDPSPNAVAEAMAYGLPSVTTRVGGIPEIVHDGEHGILVDADDADQTATALLRLLRDPELADRMGAKSRARVTNEWNWAQVAARMAPGLEAAASGGR